MDSSKLPISRPPKRGPTSFASLAPKRRRRAVRRRCWRSARPSPDGRNSEVRSPSAAATVAAAVRRIGLAGELPSGRVRFDVEEILSALGPVEVNLEAEADLFAPAPEDPPLVSDDPIELIVAAAAPSTVGRQRAAVAFRSRWRRDSFLHAPRTHVDDGRRTSWHLRRYWGRAVQRPGAGRVTAQTRPRQTLSQGRPSHHVASMTLGSSDDVAISPLRDYLLSRSSNRRMGTAHRTRSRDRAVADARRRARRRATSPGNRSRAGDHRRNDSRGVGSFALSPCPRFTKRCSRRSSGPAATRSKRVSTCARSKWTPVGTPRWKLLSRPDVMGHLSDWRAGSALGLRMQASIMTSSALAIITVPRARSDVVSAWGGGHGALLAERRDARTGPSSRPHGLPLRRRRI